MSASLGFTNFDEYRLNSWVDECKIHKDRREEEFRSQSISTRPSSTGFTSHEGNQIHDSMSHLPPPMESRDRLSRNPISADFTAIPNPSFDVFKPRRQRSCNTDTNLKNSYIMPSSLVPIEPPVNPSKLMRAPTAFMDELPFLNRGLAPSSFRLKTNVHENESNYDIIEIKSPSPDSTTSIESEYGLGCSNFQLFRTKESSNSLQSSSSDASSKSRIRKGLFDLPEVYCPPPLPVQRNKNQVHPRTALLEGVMPSFIENTLKTHKIERDRSYSEPNFKSREDLMMSGGGGVAQHPKPMTLLLSPRRYEPPKLKVHPDDLCYSGNYESNPGRMNDKPKPYLYNERHQFTYAPSNLEKIEVFKRGDLYIDRGCGDHWMTSFEKYEAQKNLLSPRSRPRPNMYYTY